MCETTEAIERSPVLQRKLAKMRLEFQEIRRDVQKILKADKEVAHGRLARRHG